MLNWLRRGFVQYMPFRSEVLGCVVCLPDGDEPFLSKLVLLRCFRQDVLIPVLPTSVLGGQDTSADRSCSTEAGVQDAEASGPDVRSSEQALQLARSPCSIYPTCLCFLLSHHVRWIWSPFREGLRSQGSLGLLSHSPGLCLVS